MNKALDSIQSELTDIVNKYPLRELTIISSPTEVSPSHIRFVPKDIWYKIPDPSPERQKAAKKPIEKTLFLEFYAEDGGNILFRIVGVKKEKEQCNTIFINEANKINTTVKSIFNINMGIYNKMAEGRDSYLHLHEEDIGNSGQINNIKNKIITCFLPVFLNKFDLLFI